MVPGEQFADCKNEDFYLTYRTIVLLEEAISIDQNHLARMLIH
jgi:hypothetical protein